MAIADKLHAIAVALNDVNNAVTDDQTGEVTIPSLPRKGGTIVDEMLNVIFAADAAGYSSAGISTVEDAVFPLVNAFVNPVNGGEQAPDLNPDDLDPEAEGSGK